MVRSNLSLGGKLLLILLTIVIFVACIAGALVAVVTQVKVRTIAGLIPGGEQFIGESYDGTILEFIQKVSATLNSGDLSLADVREISPYAGGIIDNALTNAEASGLFKFDREKLETTPLSAFSTSVTDLVVFTASLEEVASFAGISLPAMPYITGRGESEPLDVYTLVTDETGTIDRAFSMSDTEWVYLTRTENYRNSYVDEGSERPLVTFETAHVYAVAGAQIGGGYLTLGGATVYLASAEGGHARIAESSARLRGEEGNYSVLLYEGESLCLRTAPDEFEPIAALPAGTETTATIAAPYRYFPLYAQTADGYVLATQTDENGNYVVDEANGGYAILEEYRESELFYIEYTYTPAETAQGKLYVRTDGIADLPVVFAVNALTGILNAEALTLEKVGEYFGVGVEAELLDTIRYAPLSVLSTGLSAELNNLPVDSVLTLNADSSRILLFLAYGAEGVGYRIEGDTLVVLERRTVGELFSCIDEITVGDAIGTGEGNSLLEAIAGWSLKDFSDAEKINSLSLRDVLGDSVEGSSILAALADVPIGEMSEAINSVQLKDVIEDMESNSLLASLKNSTLETLSADISALTVQGLFADSIYAYNEVGTVADHAALSARYGDLYLYERGSYVLYKAGVTEADPTEKLYSPYFAITVSDLANYANVPLYALEEGSFVLATGVLSYKLPETADAAATYYLDIEGTQPVAADGAGNYAAEILYVWDAATEKMRRVSLTPASYGILPGYEGKELFTRLRPATKNADGTYAEGNLFAFDIAADTWVSVGTEAVRGADGSLAGYKTDAEGALYTYGQVTGVWKYLLTQDGAEVRCTIEKMNTLIANVTRNLNTVTIAELYADGIVEVSDPSLLVREIPYDVLGISDEEKENVFSGAVTMGDLSLNGLLDLTLRMLAFLDDLPSFGG